MIGSFDFLSDSDETWEGLEAFIAEEAAPMVPYKNCPNNKRSLDTDDDDFDFFNPEKIARLVTDVSSDEDEAGEDPRLLQQRFGLMNRFTESLNLCDNDGIERLLRDSCSSDMSLRFPRLKTVHAGNNALLVFWLICHEVFPDGIMKILESREVKMTQPRGREVPAEQLRPTIEVVYRFCGSRIISQSPAAAVGTFLSLHKDIANLSIAEVTERVLQFVSSGEHMAAAPDALTPDMHSAIAETVVQFEPGTAKAVDWAFTVLASDGL